MPYRAVFRVRKAAATIKMTARSTAISSLPMGSHRSFSLSSRAMRSVPPVVAPWRNTMPRDSPISTPPKMQAISGSSMGGQS